MWCQDRIHDGRMRGKCRIQCTFSLALPYRILLNTSNATHCTIPRTPPVAEEWCCLNEAQCKSQHHDENHPPNPKSPPVYTAHGQKPASLPSQFTSEPPGPPSLPTPVPRAQTSLKRLHSQHVPKMSHSGLPSGASEALPLNYKPFSTFILTAESLSVPFQNHTSHIRPLDQPLPQLPAPQQKRVRKSLGVGACRWEEQVKSTLNFHSGGPE